MCSSQVIGDMEGADVLPDVRLLCQLVVADEDIRKACRHRAPDMTAAVQPMQPGVPRVAAALVKELIRMSKPESRRGLILRCARELNTWPALGSLFARQQHVLPAPQ
jgi:hypothetical protein